MVDAPPAMDLMTVTVPPRGAPSLGEAARQLGVAVEDMDAAFGVVPIDPDRGIYAVQVRAGKLPGQQGVPPKDYHGPWSNPRIEPFGPVHDDKNDK
jgi:hypothetical protein